MKVALAQLNPTIGDFSGNTQKIAKAVEKARGNSCDLVVLPEMAITGYPPRDLLENAEFVERNIDHLHRLVQSIKGIGVICGFVDKNPDEGGNTLFNSAVLFENGKILHKANKRLLPTYDVFDERRYFETGKESSPFSYRDYSLGLTICEDIFNERSFFPRLLYPDKPVQELIKKGANLLINISASPYNVGKRESKWEMFSDISRRHKVPFIYVNQVGGNDSLLFDGLSLVFGPQGQLIARARDFQEDMIFYDTDTKKGAFHEISETGVESVLKALIMGTGDYIGKTGFTKAVVGLSGGLDSALVLYIAAMALGKENVTAVFMPSQYTSRQSFEDTRRLSNNLGVSLLEVPIQEIFDSFLKGLSPFFQGVATEITGQNIQARIRGLLLMAFSNKFGHMVLSTGNKSELAVGYCTLYGDMSGGLSVISDVPKTMVYRIAEFINKEKEVIPKSIIQKPPSAELKPEQLDQDELPPYEVMDPVLKAYIEENKTAKDIVDMGFDPEVVKDVIDMVHRNEYKRYQSPPGLKVTTKSFGYGRRFPIAFKPWLD